MMESASCLMTSAYRVDTSGQFKVTPTGRGSAVITEWNGRVDIIQRYPCIIASFGSARTISASASASSSSRERTASSGKYSRAISQKTR